MFDSTHFTGGPYPVNRRSNQRFRSYLHGKLIFEGPAFSADCTIRNLSQIGARVDVPVGAVYPAHALLLVTKTGAVHESTTIWASATAVGLCFDRSFDLNAGAPSRLGEAYRLWMEHRLR